MPTDDPRFGQVEMFVYLTEMTPDLGPTHVVSSEHTAHLPPIPNHLDGPDHAHLHERGELVLGPPGTLLVYRPDLVHRGRAIRRPRAARFTLHLNLRTAAAEWANRGPWGNTANRPSWRAFVEHCGLRELALFGFPAPGHAYWTNATLDGVASRYPDLDMSPWWAALH